MVFLFIYFLKPRFTFWNDFLFTIPYLIFFSFKNQTEDDKLPESCTCEDGSDITPNEISSEVLEGRIPNGQNFRKVKRRLKKAFKRCKPTTCSCPSGGGISLVNPIFDHDLWLKVVKKFIGPFYDFSHWY